MPTALITAAAEDPVELGELMEWLHLDGTAEDPTLSGLIRSATIKAQTITRRQLVTATHELYLDCFPMWEIRLPLPPLQSVTSIKYIDTNGVEQTLSAPNYLVDAESEPGRVQPAYGLTWPTTRYQANAVTIRFVAGYGSASAVPETLKTAIKTLCAHRFENREATTDRPLTEIPLGVMSMLVPFRRKLGVGSGASCS